MSRPHVVPAVRAGALPAAIPAVMRSVDATLPVQELRTIEEQAAETQARSPADAAKRIGSCPR